MNSRVRVALERHVEARACLGRQAGDEQTRDKNDLQSMQTFTIRREMEPAASNVPTKGSTRVQ